MVKERDLERFCDGLSRRNALKIGSLSLMGLSISLADLLKLQAETAEPSSSRRPSKDISCILIWLQGGPSTMDMWDLKPDAPGEFRGPFKEISTNLPGIRSCEHLPQCSRRLDKLSLLRSFSHGDASHEPAGHYMMTGHMAGPGFVDADGIVNNQRPCYGAVVAKELNGVGALPPYVTIPSLPKSGGSAYLGPAAAPFVIASDPSAPDFCVRDLRLPSGIDGRRLENRRGLLGILDRFQKLSELAASR